MDSETILMMTAEVLGSENDPRDWPEDWQSEFVEDMQRKIYFFGLLGFSPADRFLRALNSLIELAHKTHGLTDNAEL